LEAVHHHHLLPLLCQLPNLPPLRSLLTLVVHPHLLLLPVVLPHLLL